jgi:hypothetical protein
VVVKIPATDSVLKALQLPALSLTDTSIEADAIFFTPEADTVKPISFSDTEIFVL